MKLKMEFKMIKKISITTITSCIILLAGCSSTIIPYDVVKELDHPSRLTIQEFPIGVSQEKWHSENTYRVTAKLGKFSTMSRARMMALHHAAIIAEQQGYKGFVIQKENKGSWCQTLRNKQTQQIGKVDGGVNHRMLIKLSNGVKNKKYRVAESVLSKTQPQIELIPERTTLEQIADERIKHCSQKAKKKTGRRILSNL